MEKKWFQKEKTIGGKEPLINKSPIVKNSPVMKDIPVKRSPVVKSNPLAKKPNSPVVKSSPIVKDIPVKKNTQLTKKILIAVVLFISLGLFSLIITSEEGFFENALDKIKKIGGFGGESSSNDSGSSSSSSSSGGSGGTQFCGDGTCNSNENGISCPSDCVTECNDGSDNDNDGDIDLDDSGCANSNDDTESSGGSSSDGSSEGGSGDGGSSCGDGTCDSDEDGALCPSDCVTECNDGDDDDGDGWEDLVDPGCDNLNDDDESNADTGFQCSNNLDDDGNGLIDGEDPLCSYWMDNNEFSTIKIIRDNWGIPHILADTDSDAFFGMGYIMAKDRMYQMHRIRMIMQGRYSELVGFVNEEYGNSPTNSTWNDEKFRHMGHYYYAEQRFQNLDQETKNMLTSFKDGVNSYLQENQQDLLYLFDNVPENWTEIDSLASWDYLVYPKPQNKEIQILDTFETEVSNGKTWEEAAESLIPNVFVSNDLAQVLEEDVPIETRQAIIDYGNLYPPFANLSNNWSYPPGHMSHAWVVSGENSTSGSAILMSDPQLFIRSPSTFYELHIRGDTFDARGVAFPGAPGVNFIGFNKKVAWGLTASSIDNSDLFKLEMVGQDQYIYDGVTYDMEISNEQILVNGGSPIDITVKRTILGPVVTPLLSSAEQGEEYVMVAIPLALNNSHTLESTIGIMRAQDVFELETAFQKYQSPAVNLVAGDSNGDIAYSHLTAYPTRSSSSPLAGYMAQYGNSSEYFWQGFVPSNLKPKVFNPKQGVLFTANHLVVGNWYSIFRGTLVGGGGDTERSRRLRELLIESNKNIFSPEDVLNIHYDSVNSVKRDFIKSGLYIRDNLGTGNLSNDSLNLLENVEEWYSNGAKMITSERYLAGAISIDPYFREDLAPNLVNIWGSGSSGLILMLKNISEKIDETQPGVNVLNNDEISYIDNRLNDSWNSTIFNFGQPNEWQENLNSTTESQFGGNYSSIYFRANFEKYGGLDSAYDAYYPNVIATELQTIRSQRAQTYSQFIDLADPDSAKSILPFGNSENPNSIYFNNTASDWINGILHPAPLTESIIETMEDSTTYLTYN